MPSGACEARKSASKGCKVNCGWNETCGRIGCFNSYRLGMVGGLRLLTSGTVPVITCFGGYPRSIERGSFRSVMSLRCLEWTISKSRINGVIIPDVKQCWPIDASDHQGHIFRLGAPKINLHLQPFMWSIPTFIFLLLGLTDLPPQMLYNFLITPWSDKTSHEIKLDNSIQ